MAHIKRRNLLCGKYVGFVVVPVGFHRFFINRICHTVIRVREVVENMRKNGGLL